MSTDEQLPEGVREMLQTEGEPSKAELMNAIVSLSNELQDLRRENRVFRQERRQLLHAKDRDDDGEPVFGSVFIADKPLVTMWRQTQREVDDLADDVEQTDADLRDERDERAAADAKLRRRLTALADAADVEVSQSDVLGEDKIRRVIKHGAGDVTDGAPKKTAMRAQEVLRNIGRWGQLVEDANGKRFVITSPVIRDRLQDVRNSELYPSQVRRAMEQIVTWGEDSPRTVKLGKSQSGTRQLRIELEDQ